MFIIPYVKFAISVRYIHSTMLAYLDAARQHFELTVNHANALLVSCSDDGLYTLSNALDDVRMEVDNVDEYVCDMVNYIERGV